MSFRFKTNLPSSWKFYLSGFGGVISLGKIVSSLFNSMNFNNIIIFIVFKFRISVYVIKKRGEISQIKKINPNL